MGGSGGGDGAAPAVRRDAACPPRRVRAQWPKPSAWAPVAWAGTAEPNLSFGANLNRG